MFYTFCDIHFYYICHSVSAAASYLIYQIAFVCFSIDIFSFLSYDSIVTNICYKTEVKALL